MAGAEIDIAEFFGKGYQQGGLASFLYNYAITDSATASKIGGLAPSATRMLPPRDAWWKRFHVFSLEWTRTPTGSASTAASTPYSRGASQGSTST